MLASLPDLTDLVFLLLGALAAGFVTGFAGFGTGLVASGFWFHVLPAAVVPPLVVMASVAAQFVSLIGVRPVFDWARALPYLIGGALGVPLGVVALSLASPELLRLSVGIFLVFYALCQFAGLTRLSIGAWGGRSSDAAVGVGGGVLGGFAGLSGPLPLIWLQLRGGPSLSQRAVYQPFNLIVLALAAIGMASAGQIDRLVLSSLVIAIPATVIGAWLGARLYRQASEAAFRKVVLGLLLTSGAMLTIQSLW
ncbi:sulfite exporter TauE/SafE family protein [Pelagibius litoralis]|uniref:Probable membrane transporter protein n=1 Tax=Pelagibius litoralis TaxID=374515 RepID=A0A967KAX4_9PROT|nr:sulfite exporter TauE/SafE family protein [Pelagibius litoralis]NIA70722.1 sulfite exporter TauE/SafE family protein [Pelagibius litoralis]